MRQGRSSWDRRQHVRFARKIDWCLIITTTFILGAFIGYFIGVMEG
jgi:hypothetical protein